MKVSGADRLLILVGLIVIGAHLHIGVRYYRHPGKLGPDSWLYRYWLLDWQTGLRRSAKATVSLSEKRIRYYAVRALIAAGLVGLAVIGIILG